MSMTPAAINHRRCNTSSKFAAGVNNTGVHDAGKNFAGVNDADGKFAVGYTPVHGYTFSKICTDRGVAGGNLPPVSTTPTVKETETERKKEKREENR